MKKAVVLLIVLGFIIVIISISTILLKIYDKYSSSSYQYISQDSLFIKNTKNILIKYLKDKNIYKLINKTYPIMINQSLNLQIKISPILNKFNINNYIENNKTNIYIDDTLNNILEYYEILDPLYFKNILLDTIDNDTISRDKNSEIINTNPYFQNGAIYNYKHFQMILNYYYKQTKDKNIYKIPWKQYIFFGEKKKYILDCNLINKNLAHFMGLKFKNDIISCKNLITTKISQAFNVHSFDKNKSYLLNIEINYKKNDINLTFDTKTGGIFIEKHFIY